jgi:hypothetical protein
MNSHRQKTLETFARTAIQRNRSEPFLMESLNQTYSRKFSGKASEKLLNSE